MIDINYKAEFEEVSSRNVKLADALNRIADLGTCGRAKTPAYKLFQEAIDIATSALS